MSDAIDAVTAAKQSLEDAINYLNRLENSKDNLSKATAAKTEADAKLATAKAELETELAKLATLKETSDAAQAKYEEVKARYDALVKAQDELNNNDKGDVMIHQQHLLLMNNLNLKKPKKLKNKNLLKNNKNLQMLKRLWLNKEKTSKVFKNGLMTK